MIVANFNNNERSVYKFGLEQYDYGQILRIKGLSLPDAVEIHFSLQEKGGEAVRRMGTTQDGVTDVVIPDFMLENPAAHSDSYYIFAFIYLTDETSGHTEYRITMNVKTRPKPADFLPPDEPDFAQQLINTVAKEREAAQRYAEEAGNIRTDVSGIVEQAVSANNSAIESAKNAMNSERNAGTYCNETKTVYETAKLAEDERKKAEAERVVSEEERVKAETIRVQNEEKRQADNKVIGDKIDELKSDLICLKGNVWNAVTDGGCDNTGVADCTGIVQSAINEAPDCSVLYFPKGNYLFNRNLVIEQKKGLKICGDGRGWYGTLFTVKYDYSFIIIYGGEKITLENFSIKGNGSTTSRAIAFSDNTPTTMECRTCDTMVKNISITRFSSGIELSCPSGYNYFENISISMFPSNGTGFAIGSLYNNTGTTDGGHTILPNYVYFTNCNVDGNNDNSYKIDGLHIKSGQYVVIDKCDFCNSENGINIINNNGNKPTVCDIYVNNTSLYNNQNGVTINPFANGIQRISINNCMIVTNGKRYSYALAVYKRDGVDLIKNISFIGNIMRDYSGVNRLYFNVPGVDTDTFLKIGLGC